MIIIKIEDLEFYDDAVVLVKSFYPRKDVTNKEVENPEMTISVWTPDKTGKTKSQYHDEFKEALYLQLVKMTGRNLPWGNITGVRPSKMAVLMIEQGKSDEQVMEFFQKEHFVSREKAELALKIAKKELKLLGKVDYHNGYSLYIGIPFCPTTCLYCSFTSYSVAAWKSHVEEYLDALIKEMHYVGEAMKGKRLDTIYFGGGTPTTLMPEQLDRLLTELEQSFDVDNAYELTVEAGRPDSITKEKLLVLKKHKVGRISINPQTMNQVTLDIIGRRHTVEQVKEAFALARDCGFDNINMDLIMGLPGEDADMIRNTLDQILELSPESLTVHSLAIKRASKINMLREKYKDFEFKNTEEIINMSEQYAHDMHLEPYYMYRQKNMTGNFENVGYSVPGQECIYNVLIMEEKQTIIALGAGASSKIVTYKEDQPLPDIERIENVKNVRDYIDRIDEMIERKRKCFEKYSD